MKKYFIESIFISLIFFSTAFAQNIASNAAIDYSSISNSSYEGYTPNAYDTVDGLKCSGFTFWTANTGSASGWISFEFEEIENIGEIKIYSGYNNYYLKYSVLYEDANNNWISVFENEWVNEQLKQVELMDDIADCIVPSTGQILERIFFAHTINGVGSNIGQWICAKQSTIKYDDKFQMFNCCYLMCAVKSGRA